MVFFEVFNDGETPYRHIKSLDTLLLKLTRNEIRPKAILHAEVNVLVAKQFEPEEVRWSTEQMFYRWKDFSASLQLEGESLTR